MDLIAALGQTYDHTHGVVAGVGKDQLDNPTPCTAWNVAELLSHTIGVISNIGSAVVSGAPAGTPTEVELGADLGEQFRAAADGNLTAWKAAGLDGETDIGAGPMPRQAAISINLLDTATHSWDIAHAIGQDGELPADLAQLILGICHGFVTDEIRSFAGFSPAVTVGADASPTRQLVAFLGRQP